jgi:hypothetical protein
MARLTSPHSTCHRRIWHAPELDSHIKHVSEIVHIKPLYEIAAKEATVGFTLSRALPALSLLGTCAGVMMREGEGERVWYLE